LWNGFFEAKSETEANMLLSQIEFAMKKFDDSEVFKSSNLQNMYDLQKEAYEFYKKGNDLQADDDFLHNLDKLNQALQFFKKSEEKLGEALKIDQRFERQLREVKQSSEQLSVIIGRLNKKQNQENQETNQFQLSHFQQVSI
jgi:hypothetical protein